MRTDAKARLDERETAARARVRAAVRDLEASVGDLAGSAAAAHPWSLPVMGFCAGLLASCLVPDRRYHPEENGHDRR